MATVVDRDGAAVEIGPGRGDLRYRSVPLDPSLPVDWQLREQRLSFHELYRSQPWVAGCIRRMLTYAARVPLKTYRRTGDDSRDRLRDHPVSRALAAPWRGGSQIDLVSHLVGSLLVHGNALVEVERVGRELNLRPVDYRFARPIQPDYYAVDGWVLDHGLDGLERTRDSADVLDVRFWAPTGAAGLSPLQQLGVTTKLIRSADTFQQALFDNGARPPSALTVTDKFLGIDVAQQQQAMANLRDDVTRLHVGAQNAGRPPLLPPGVSWDAVGHTAVEAELIAQREVARDEMAAVLQVPPAVFGTTAGADIHAHRQVAYVDGLGPVLAIVEQAFNAQVVRELLLEDDVYVEFDFGAVLRGSAVDEITAIREAIATGVMTPNEGRTLLNRPRSTVDGADELFLPRNNLIPLGIPYVADGMHLPDAPPADDVTPDPS